MRYRYRRQSAKRRIVTLVLTWCLGACAAGFSQESVDAAVERVQKRYASIASIKGDFRQVYRAPGIEQTESGVFWMKRPGLMRWEYRVPEQKLFIAGGQETYLYTPEDRQVLVEATGPAELHSTPLAFLLGRGDIAKGFSAAWEKDMQPKVEGTVLLRLVPRVAEPEFEYLVLECDAQTYDLRRLVIREHGGNTSTFFFSNLTTNLKIDNKMFQFKIPKGVEVVRLSEKE